MNHAREELKKECFLGYINSPVGKVPQINTKLTLGDVWGSWKNRCGIDRLGFRVNPGLYAIGYPDRNSPVLVSANYKLSFDQLRKSLTGWNIWLLILDTKGINVWCAAGKGTFSTNELINRINTVQLDLVVTHKTLILPQLSASGVSAHEVVKKSGFRIKYGPIRATDLPNYLQTNYQATKEMREVQFSLIDRAVLIPIEIVHGVKPLGLILLILFLLSFISPGGISSKDALFTALIAFLPFLGGAITGIVLAPLLLPWIPGRAFSWKGWLLGFIWTAYVHFTAFAPNSSLSSAAIFLIVPSISAFFTLNFTGSTPFTSLSGVKKEMKIAVPLIVASIGLGIIFTLINIFREFLPL